MSPRRPGLAASCPICPSEHPGPQASTQRTSPLEVPSPELVLRPPERVFSQSRPQPQSRKRGVAGMIIRLGDGGVTLCPAWGPPAAPTPVRVALSAAPGSGREPPAGACGEPAPEPAWHLPAVVSGPGDTGTGVHGARRGTVSPRRKEVLSKQLSGGRVAERNARAAFPSFPWNNPSDSAPRRGPCGSGGRRLAGLSRQDSRA